MGGHTGKASIANSHSPCQASHFPGNSASESGQGRYCLYIMVPTDHRSNFPGIDHNLHKSHPKTKKHIREKQHRNNSKQIGNYHSKTFFGPKVNKRNLIKHLKLTRQTGKLNKAISHYKHIGKLVKKRENAST